MWAASSPRGDSTWPDFASFLTFEVIKMSRFLLVIAMAWCSRVVVGDATAEAEAIQITEGAYKRAPVNENDMWSSGSDRWPQFVELREGRSDQQRINDKFIADIPQVRGGGAFPDIAGFTTGRYCLPPGVPDRDIASKAGTRHRRDRYCHCRSSIPWPDARRLRIPRRERKASSRQEPECPSR